MPEIMMLSVAMLASIAGMGWLALAMEPHWGQVFGSRAQRPGTIRALRVAGSVALALSLGLCLGADHPSMAALVWIMTLAAGALTVAFTLSWRPGLLRVLLPGV